MVKNRYLITSSYQMTGGRLLKTGIDLETASSIVR
jgi:hypothetical protein